MEKDAPVASNCESSPGLAFQINSIGSDAAYIAIATAKCCSKHLRRWDKIARSHLMVQLQDHFIIAKVSMDSYFLYFVLLSSLAILIYLRDSSLNVAKQAPLFVLFQVLISFK